MTDLVHSLSELRRPRLLLRAAEFGARTYRRRRDLPHLLGATADAPDPLGRLLRAEAALDTLRRSAAAGYAAQRHVGILAAIIAEARRAADDAPGPRDDAEDAMP